MTKTEWRAWLRVAELHEKGKGPKPAPLAYADVNDLFMHADEQEARRKTAEKYLAPLADVTGKVIKAVDALMDLPATPERGRKVAALMNGLERQVEQAKYFGLGHDVHTGKPPVRVKRLQSRQGSPELKRALAVLLPASEEREPE